MRSNGGAAAFCQRIRWSTFTVSLMLATASGGLAIADDFSVDRASPDPAGSSPSDIHDRAGASILVKATDLGVDVADDIDAFSYGEDEIEPFGPNFYVSIIYSVSPQTVGGTGGIGPGRGAVRAQAAGNGAAGDKFYLKAVWAGPTIGMFPISRGLLSDGPMHNLPDRVSDIDGLSRPAGKVDGPIFFSVDPQGAVGQNWHPADILVVIPGGTPQVWATRAQLGLAQGDNIDALAIANGSDPSLGPGDVIYVSLDQNSPSRTTNTASNFDEAVYQIYPGPMQMIFSAEILNLNSDPTEEMDAMTGFDPGEFPEGLPPHGDPPPPQQLQLEQKAPTP